MTNCNNCGDYLREKIVRGCNGRIQTIDIELCRRPSCRRSMKAPRSTRSASSSSWLGDLLDGFFDFVGDILR